MATEEALDAPLMTKADFEYDEVPIGRGGFGTVYRAKHKDLGIVAVKTLIDNGMLPQKHTRVLKKEAKKLLEVCGHPSVLNLLGMIMEKDNYSLILEYMALGSLVDFRKEFHVQWPLISRIMTDIASGMEFLHTHDPQILHLDLKGDNILLNGRIRAKIADFGLSEWRTITRTVTRSTSDTSDSRRCTVSHVPPEMWANISLPSSVHFDIYSFGIVLWEMLTGCTPYKGVTDDLVRSAVLSGQRPDFTQIPKDCSAKFTQMMTRCWHQKPAQRPAFTVIKKEVDKLYLDEYEKNIVKALKKVRAEIVADYEHDDPVYTQTADIDNMQVPTFVVPIPPAPSMKTETTTAPTAPSDGGSASTSGVAMDTAEDNDEGPVEVKLYKVDKELDTKERMMRKIIHNPIAMRMMHSEYTEELFNIDNETKEALLNPKEVQRVIQSDLTLQWEMKYFKFDVRRELSGLHAQTRRGRSKLYNEVHKALLTSGFKRRNSRMPRNALTLGQDKREERLARVEKTMSNNPNIGKSSSGNFFRLKKALENPTQLQQAMKDKESGNKLPSLTTIDDEIFDLMKDPWLLVGVLYETSTLLFMLSDNCPDLFCKILQGLNGYTTYTSCYNPNRNRMRMLEMMHSRRGRDMMMHDPEEMMMEMGPRMMRNMRRHPMDDFDDEDDYMRMMMMRSYKMDDMKKMKHPKHTMGNKIGEGNWEETEASSSKNKATKSKMVEDNSKVKKDVTKSDSSSNTSVTKPALSTSNSVSSAAAVIGATDTGLVTMATAPVGRSVSSKATVRNHEVAPSMSSPIFPEPMDDSKESSGISTILGSALGMAKNMFGMRQSKDSPNQTSPDPEDIDVDGPISQSLETDATPPLERVQGAPNIIPQGLPDIHQSTRPVQPRPQGQLLNPGHNSNMANSGSNSTNSGNNVEIPSSNSTNSSSNVKNPGSHVGEAVPTSSVFVPNFEPMDVDPFPSLLTQDSAASADSGVATSTSGIADETSVKKVYQPAPQVYPPAPPAVESRPPQASRSGVTTETQGESLLGDVSMDANPSMESVITGASNAPGYTVTKHPRGDGAMDHTIYHERHGAKTTIQYTDDGKRLPPNIQVGDRNYMVVGGKGDVRKSRSDQVDVNKPIPSDITKSTRVVKPEKDFDCVAEHIGNGFRRLGRQLGLPNSNIDNVEMDFTHEGSYEVCYQMLKKWMLKDGKQATVAKLASCLCHAGKPDIARLLK